MIRLRARDLHKSYSVPGGVVRAVRGVSIDLKAGETLAVVGESGCGKSTLARLLVGLEKPDSGTIHRDAEIQDQVVPMVFQDSLSSFHPRRRVRDILLEPILIRQGRWLSFGVKAARDAATAQRLAEQVGLSSELLNRYPHELSGGQGQRVNIGRALALRSDVIVLDEPVSALDVSIQAQILNLLKDLQAKRSLSMVLITHDLAVVRYLAHRVSVLYLGQVVEEGPAQTVLERPHHPYTETLLMSEPSASEGPPVRVVTGEPPSPLEIPPGCSFASRCPKATGGWKTVCGSQIPKLSSHSDRRFSCHVRSQELELGHAKAPTTEASIS